MKPRERESRRQLLVAVAAMLVMASCESPVSVEPIPGVADLRAGRPTQSVSGSGGFTVGDGLLRTFSFNARTLVSGETSGVFAGFNRQSGG